jgi:negative regulator of replication initiation
VGDARYQYTKDINALLSSENMGWKLRKGQLERLGSEVLDREVVEKARKILLNPDFAGPNNQFNKALEFFSKRPKPDLVNCVKEAVCALEGFTRILLKDNKITLGDATNQLVGKGILRKPLDKPFHALYGFVSSEPWTDPQKLNHPEC